MNTIRILSAAVFVTSTALASAAQPEPVAPAPMTEAAMSPDCTKPMAKHNHGADKGLPASKTAMSEPCAAAAAASASASKAKAKAKHDHSTTKNN